MNILFILLIVGSLILGGFLLFGSGESDTSDTCTKGNPVLSSTICPTDTCECENDRSHDHTIPYYSELNINSSCDEIKDYILANLERKNTRAFDIVNEDRSHLTDARKKELIFILENSSDMDYLTPIMRDGIELRSGSGIRFKFCCTTSENCIRNS